MRRLAVDLSLIFAPFAALSVFFFIGEQPRYGVAFAIVALLALVYVRVSGSSPSSSDDGDAEQSSGEEEVPLQRMPGAGMGG